MADSHSNNPQARVIAFYLPQFHPIPENDAMWGKGFTEWTNVKKARPLFSGHQQPKVPGELGYYDLGDADVRLRQAELAKQHGVEGFCYWHYWLGGGRRLLELPFNEVLQSGEPEFPFCLGWANQSWTGIWYGEPEHIFVEQAYPGIEDYRDHFYAILPALRDERYLEIAGRKAFLIYRPHEVPELHVFVDTWQELARKEGLSEFYFIGEGAEFDFKASGLDAQIAGGPIAHMKNFTGSDVTRLIAGKRSLWQKLLGRPHIFEYADVVKNNYNKPLESYQYPVLVPNWDNTPRAVANGLVWKNSTPELFAEMCTKALALVQDRDAEHRIMFIKSWNEWAEGNYMEPDETFGRGRLEAIRSIVYP